MPTRPASLLALGALALTLAACGGAADGGPTQPVPAQVASVTITPDGSSITPTQTVQLAASLRDASGNVLSGRAVNWTATPATVGTVSTTGLVTALTPGTLTVTATSEGRSGTAQVTVVNNAPVATVAVTSPVQVLIPQQTAQLTVVLKDATNNTLTGRTVTWTATPANVGTISNSGLVTAVALGTLTVTAASEGKSASVVLTVASGGTVGPAGATLNLAGGDVVVQVPSGAVSTNTTITVIPVGGPSQPPPAGWQAVGRQYALGPVGAVFLQPVTVKLKYKSGELPVWVMSGDLKLRHVSGGQWSSLANVVVDGANKTISGQTTTFAASPGATPSATPTTRGLGGEANAEEPGPTIGIGAQDPVVTMSPNAASVNFQQRSASFSVALAPNGAGVPLPANTPPLRYRWSTTGVNGAISGPAPTAWTTTTEVQYTATNANLNLLSGPIDNVKVEVLLNPGETDPAKWRIVSVQATVDADLQVTYELTPSSPVIDRGQAKTFQLLIRDKAGNVLTVPAGHELAWTTSGAWGSLGAAAPTQPFVTYTAKTTFSGPPPRVDDIKLKVTETKTSPTRVWKPAIFGGEGAWTDEEVTRTLVRGEAKTFVEVKVNYTVALNPPSKTLGANANTKLTVTLDPPEVTGIMYKYTNPGAFGTLNVANGVRTAATEVTYTANSTGGGTDKVKVEVVSVVAGVELASLGTAEANVTVDQLTAGFAVSVLTTPGGWFTSAQISIPKVAGATSYEVTATTPDGPYAKTFSGATSTDPHSVGQVLDGGGSWKINIEGGFNTIGSAQVARANLYQTKYGAVAFKIKVNM